MLFVCIWLKLYEGRALLTYVKLSISGRYIYECLQSFRLVIQGPNYFLIRIQIFINFGSLDHKIVNKVRSLFEACFLIWSRAPHFPWKFKSWAGKLLKILGSNPCSRRSISFVLFSFHFRFFTQKWISFILTTFWYLVWLIRN